jgi:hypothetical protein
MATATEKKETKWEYADRLYEGLKANPGRGAFLLGDKTSMDNTDWPRFLAIMYERISGIEYKLGITDPEKKKAAT